MPDIASITYLDHSRETANVQFNIQVVTAANIDTIQSDISDLITAAGDITLGVMRQRVLTHQFAGSGAIPSDQFAQRELKWLIGYTDTSTTIGGVPNPHFGKNFTVEAACPDLENANLATNTDFADLTDTQIAAFVTAFEAYVRSPTGGAVSVTYIKNVGRKG